MSFKSEKYITPKDGGDEAAKEAARNEAWGYVPEDSHVYENANAFIDDTNRPSNEEEADAARIDDFADDASEMYGNEKLGDLAIMARDAMRSDDVSTAKEIQNAIYSRIEKMAADGKLSTEAAVSHMENLSAIIEDNTERLFENDDLDKRVQFDNPVPVKAEIEDFGPAKISEVSDSFKNVAKPNHLLITDDEAPVIEAESPRQESHQDLDLVQEASDNVTAEAAKRGATPEGIVQEASDNVKSQAESDQGDTDMPPASSETSAANSEHDAAAVQDVIDEQPEKEQKSGRIRKFGRFALKALGINKYRAYRADKKAFIDTRKQEYNYEETPFVALDQAKRDYRKQKRAERTEKVKSFFNDAGLTEEEKDQKQAQIDRDKAARQAHKEAGDTVSQKAKQAAQNVYAKSKDGYIAFREKGRARFGVNPDAEPSDRAKEVADEIVGRTPEAAKKAEERARRQAGASEPVERSNVAPSPYDVNSTEVIDTVPLPQQDSEGSVQYPDTRNRRQNPADNRDAA